MLVSIGRSCLILNTFTACLRLHQDFPGSWAESITGRQLLILQSRWSWYFCCKTQTSRSFGLVPSIGLSLAIFGTKIMMDGWICTYTVGTSQGFQAIVAVRRASLRSKIPRRFAACPFSRGTRQRLLQGLFPVLRTRARRSFVQSQ